MAYLRENSLCLHISQSWFVLFSNSRHKVPTKQSPTIDLPLKTTSSGSMDVLFPTDFSLFLAGFYLLNDTIYEVSNLF